MPNNNIILLTNNSSIAEILKPRLVLLRDVDTILSVSYEDAVETLKQSYPESVLLYCSQKEENECIELIQELKKDQNTKNISILLIVEKINQDFILSAYDNGIADYMQLKASDDIEVLIRAIWSFQKNAVARKAYKQTELLKKLKIIDFQTGFYANGRAKEVFENETKYLETINQESIIMLVGLAPESKLVVNQEDFVSAIRMSIRNTDTVIHGVNDRFYILLPATQSDRAYFILNKIKKIIGEDIKILASVMETKNKDFDMLDAELLGGLCEIEASGENLIIVDNKEEDNETSQDWLDSMNSSKKNFKLFKQAFNKKLEKVISPVFFQMQKLYEEKIFETKIEQYSTHEVSEFILKHKNSTNVLRITYPGFSKINIEYLYQGFDTPENERLSLDLAELTEDKLSQIVSRFIKNFMKTLGD